MTGRFQEMGLELLYPENWEVLDQRSDQWPRSVTFQSPGSAFWSLEVYPHGTSPTELVGQTLRVFRGEYDHVEAELVQETIEGREFPGAESRPILGHHV